MFASWSRLHRGRSWEKMQICIFAVVPTREDPAVLETTGNPGHVGASSLTHPGVYCLNKRPLMGHI
jgi:hypothetical protein